MHDGLSHPGERSVKKGDCWEIKPANRMDRKLINIVLEPAGNPLQKINEGLRKIDLGRCALQVNFSEARLSLGPGGVRRLPQRWNELRPKIVDKL